MAVTGVSPRLLFFQRRYRRPEFIASIEPFMRRFFVLHARMQSFFHAWDRADQRSYADARRNVLDLDFLRHLMSSLNGPMMDDDSLRARLEENYALLEAFAQSWQAVACRRLTRNWPASFPYRAIAELPCTRSDSYPRDCLAIPRQCRQSRPSCRHESPGPHRCRQTRATSTRPHAGAARVAGSRRRARRSPPTRD